MGCGVPRQTCQQVLQVVLHGLHSSHMLSAVFSSYHYGKQLHAESLAEGGPVQGRPTNFVHNASGTGCHVDPRNIAQRIMTVSLSLHSFHCQAGWVRW